MVNVSGGSVEDSRATLRANVFLAAALDAGNVAWPVRIRNISATGALLDGRGLPIESVALRLRRGVCSVVCAIAWHHHDLRGVRFNAPIKLDQWVKCAGHGGQQRVDKMVFALRSSPGSPHPSDGGLGQPDELLSISAELHQVLERVSDWPDLSIEAAEEILRLDSLAQRLGKCATSRRTRLTGA